MVLGGRTSSSICFFPLAALRLALFSAPVALNLVASGALPGKLNPLLPKSTVALPEQYHRMVNGDGFFSQPDLFCFVSLTNSVLLTVPLYSLVLQKNFLFLYRFAFLEFEKQKESDVFQAAP